MATELSTVRGTWEEFRECAALALIIFIVTGIIIITSSLLLPTAPPISGSVTLDQLFH